MRLSFDDEACARGLGISTAEARTYLEELLASAQLRPTPPPKVNSSIAASAHMRKEVLDYALQHIMIVREG